MYSRYIKSVNNMDKSVAVPNVKLSNGYEMPMVGFGCFFGLTEADQIKASLDSAIDAGYRHFDNAWLYGTEETLGNIIKQKIEQGVVTREELFITSKLFWAFHDPKDVKEYVMDSVKKMGVDYLDLYLIHFPSAIKKPKDFKDINPLAGTNVERYDENDYCEVWKILESCVKEGIIKSIGVSNFTTKQIQDILNCATIKPVVNQCEVHPYYQNEEMRNFCQSNDIILSAYTPLGRSNTTLPAKQGQTYPLQDPIIGNIAKNYGKTPAQVILRFNIQRGIPVLPSSSNPQRQKENLSVFDFELHKEDMQAIESLDKNQKYWLFEYMKSYKDYPFKDLC